MTTDTEDQRNILDLQFIEGILNDENYQTHLAEKSEQYALSFLSVELSESNLPIKAYLQLMYIPSSGILDETNLLQFFSYLSEELPPLSDDSTELLKYLNTRTPLGYFSIDENGKLFYRYVYTIPKFDVPNKLRFLELFDLFSKTFDMFGSILLRLLNKEITLEEAKNKVSV